MNTKTFQVHMLPTEKAAQRGQLILDGVRLRTAHNHFSGPVSDLNPQHIYFTSDEEIKEGDWVLKDNKIAYAANSKEAIDYSQYNWNKVVDTTDPVIWGHTDNFEYEKVALIPQDFIEAYIKQYNAGNPITEVELEVEEFTESRYANGFEELYPIAKLKLTADNTVIWHPVKEITFTEADMQKAYEAGIAAHCRFMADLVPERVSFKDWFKETYPA